MSITVRKVKPGKTWECNMIRVRLYYIIIIIIKVEQLSTISYIAGSFKL